MEVSTDRREWIPERASATGMPLQANGGARRVRNEQELLGGGHMGAPPPPARLIDVMGLSRPSVLLVSAVRQAATLSRFVKSW